jgi:hypothetical protein
VLDILLEERSWAIEDGCHSGWPSKICAEISNFVEGRLEEGHEMTSIEF